MNEIIWILGGVVGIFLCTFTVLFISLSSKMSTIKTMQDTMNANLVEFARNNAQAHKEIWKEVNNSREEISYMRGAKNGKKD